MHDLLSFTNLLSVSYKGLIHDSLKVFVLSEFCALATVIRKLNIPRKLLLSEHLQFVQTSLVFVDPIANIAMYMHIKIPTVRYAHTNFVYTAMITYLE